MYLPIIAAQDFEAFRAILKSEIAPTFQEWQQGHANRLAMYPTSYVIREIKVRPDEFARFCDRKCCGYDANSMIAFAEAVGGK